MLQAHPKDASDLVPLLTTVPGAWAIRRGRRDEGTFTGALWYSQGPPAAETVLIPPSSWVGSPHNVRVRHWRPDQLLGLRL